jgi:hypothetical protein
MVSLGLWSGDSTFENRNHRIQVVYLGIYIKRYKFYSIMSIASTILDQTRYIRFSMDNSNINPSEELPEIQPTSGSPPAGEPIPHMEQHPQIEVDLPSSPAIMSRTSTGMYKE